MIQKFGNVLHSNDDMLFYNEHYYTVISDQRHILAADLNKINLDEDNNFDENDPDTFIHLRLLALRSKFKKRKALKKKINEEVMPLVWHPKR